MSTVNGLPPTFSTSAWKPGFGVAARATVAGDRDERDPGDHDEACGDWRGAILSAAGSPPALRWTSSRRCARAVVTDSGGGSISATIVVVRPPVATDSTKQSAQELGPDVVTAPKSAASSSALSSWSSASESRKLAVRRLDPAGADRRRAVALDLELLVDAGDPARALVDDERTGGVARVVVVPAPPPPQPGTASAAATATTTEVDSPRSHSRNLRAGAGAVTPPLAGTVVSRRRPPVISAPWTLSSTCTTSPTACGRC